MENEFIKKVADKAIKDEKKEASGDNSFSTKEEANEPTPKTANKKKNVNASRKSSSAFAQILNGEFLTKEFVLNNLSYIFFFIFLLLLVVAKGYYGKQLSKDVETTQHDLDEASAEYMEVKAKLEDVTRRQVLVQKLEPTGLKETVNPTKVIRLRGKKEK